MLVLKTLLLVNRGGSLSGREVVLKISSSHSCHCAIRYILSTLPTYMDLVASLWLQMLSFV